MADGRWLVTITAEFRSTKWQFSQENCTSTSNTKKKLIRGDNKNGGTGAALKIIPKSGFRTSIFPIKLVKRGISLEGPAQVHHHFVHFFLRELNPEVHLLPQMSFDSWIQTAARPPPRPQPHVPENSRSWSWPHSHDVRWSKTALRLGTCEQRESPTNLKLANRWVMEVI